RSEGQGPDFGRPDLLRQGRDRWRRRPVSVAAHLPGQLGADLLETARTAFTDGLHVAAAVGLLFALGAALLAYRLLRHLPAATPAPEPEAAAA
ncbi:hypothetical protein ACWC9T_33370, partial [Kitasatospora sp. NPDC001159]